VILDKLTTIDKPDLSTTIFSGAEEPKTSIDQSKVEDSLPKLNLKLMKSKGAGSNHFNTKRISSISTNTQILNAPPLKVDFSAGVNNSDLP